MLASFVTKEEELQELEGSKWAKFTVDGFRVFLNPALHVDKDTVALDMRYILFVADIIVKGLSVQSMFSMPTYYKKDGNDMTGQKVDPVGMEGIAGQIEEKVFASPADPAATAAE